MPVRPFMGIDAIAPDEPGPVLTVHPGHRGGKLDCQESELGVKLFLPVLVPGALISEGGGHGVLRPGEVTARRSRSAWTSRSSD